jgi:hypothetical protein
MTHFWISRARGEAYLDGWFDHMVGLLAAGAIVYGLLWVMNRFSNTSWSFDDE